MVTIHGIYHSSNCLCLSLPEVGSSIWGIIENIYHNLSSSGLARNQFDMNIILYWKKQNT